MYQLIINIRFEEAIKLNRPLNLDYYLPPVFILSITLKVISNFSSE